MASENWLLNGEEDGEVRRRKSRSKKKTMFILVCF